MKNGRGEKTEEHHGQHGWRWSEHRHGTLNPREAKHMGTRESTGFCLTAAQQRRKQTKHPSFFPLWLFFFFTNQSLFWCFAHIGDGGTSSTFVCHEIQQHTANWSCQRRGDFSFPRSLASPSLCLCEGLEAAAQNLHPANWSFIDWGLTNLEWRSSFWLIFSLQHLAFFLPFFLFISISLYCIWPWYWEAERQMLTYTYI